MAQNQLQVTAPVSLMVLDHICTLVCCHR